MATTPPRRPFTLLDSLVLLAAIAGGLGLTRSLAGLRSVGAYEAVDYYPRGHRDPTGKLTMSTAAYFHDDYKPSGRAQAVAYWTQRAAFWPCPCLAAWTLTCLVLTYRNSRPARRKLFRRPGFMAGLAWAVGLLAAALSNQAALATWAVPAAPALIWRDWWFLTWFWLPRTAGYAVTVTWMTLALSGRFEAGSGWPDRLGTVAGVCWVALGFLSLLTSWLIAF
jgi:hypothetical protein